MNRILKGVMVGFLLFLILAAVRTTAMAQLSFGFPQLWKYPSSSSDSQQIPEWWKCLRSGDILVDDFEYWDSTYNHGWYKIEPAYPTYGYDDCYGFGSS